MKVQIQSVLGLNKGTATFSQRDSSLLLNGKAQQKSTWGGDWSLWKVDHRLLRGRLQVVPLGSKGKSDVAVVLHLPIERYLVGVLSKEVEPDWPVAALAAQAVAARSYALAAWQWQGKRAWCLQAEATADMAFAGHVLPAKVHPHLQQAISMTKGEVLWWQDQAVSAFSCMLRLVAIVRCRTRYGLIDSRMCAPWPPSCPPDQILGPRLEWRWRQSD